MITAALLLAAGSPNPAWNCDDPQAQQEMNWCAAQEYEKADQALNAQWAKTAAVMKQRDADQDLSDGGPGFFETLLKAQRAWITYRDAHCMSEGFKFRGGTMAPLIVGTCKSELTNVRTRQLMELIETEG